MKTYRCEIPLRLPSLNDYILACRKNKFAGGKFKEKIDSQIIPYVKDLPTFQGKISIHFHWVEANKKRDPDNIASGCKYILDAMQKSGVLYNDNWQWIDTDTGFSHSFEVGDYPKIILTIKEIEHG